jgi:hypothetical protein
MITVSNLDANVESKFVWTITRGECKTSASVAVMNMSYVADIKNTDMNPVLCDVSSIDLTANNVEEIYGNGVKGWWTWETKNASANTVTIGDNISLASVTASGLPYGETTFTWNVKGQNCDATSKSITVKNETVTADANGNPEADKYTCTTKYKYLKAVSGNSEWSGYWTCIGGQNYKDVTFSESTSNQTSAKGLTFGGGAYQFKWTVMSPEYVATKGAKGS